MSKAEELADALDAMRIDPALCHHMVVPEVEAAAAELRRLAQVEAEHAALLKAISDAEPVAWSAGINWSQIKHYQSEQVQKLTRESQPEHGFTVPLYTLNGIKKP